MKNRQKKQYIKGFKTMRNKKVVDLRQEQIEKYLSNSKDDGRYGRVFECDNARKGSKKIGQAPVGSPDGHAKFKNADGSVRYVRVEFKTNGGRTKDLPKSKYTVYRLDICNSGTSYMRRYVDPVIIPTQIFLDFLNKNGLIKSINRNGKFDGYGIQATSKKLYLALLDWCIPYDKDTVYTEEDFEGLTLE